MDIKFERFKEPYPCIISPKRQLILLHPDRVNDNNIFSNLEHEHIHEFLLKRIGRKAYYDFENIAEYVESEDKFNEAIELKKEIQKKLFSPVTLDKIKEWNTCPYCNHKLNRYGLCTKCDLGIEIEPDEYEEF